MKKTNDFVFNRDMNFIFLSLKSDIQGTVKKIDRAKSTVLDQIFCNHDLVGEIQASTEYIIRQEKYKSPTECVKLGEKAILTDIEKMKIINYTKLGSNPIQIASSILDLYKVHPTLFDHPDQVSLKATLTLQSGGNSVGETIASPISMSFLTKSGPVININCMETVLGKIPLYLDLKPLEKGSKVFLTINEYKMDLLDYPSAGSVNQMMSEINVSLDTEGSYVYKNHLIPLAIGGRNVASSNTTFNTNYCNTLRALNDSLACGSFLKHLRDNVIPYL